MKNIKQLFLLGCWLLTVQAIWAQNPNCETVSTENEFDGEAFLNYGSASDAFNTEYRSNFTIGQPVVGTYFGQAYNGGFGYWARNYLSPDAPVVTASEGDLVDRIQITWQPDALSPAASEGFKIYRDGSLLATVDNATSSFIDFNVIAGVFYEYEVAGINSFGEGPRGSSLGFLNPNGVVTGQVKSGSGNPVPEAIVTLTPSLGSALAFDGTDDMAFVEYDPVFPRDAFTLSCWVKLEGTNDSTGIFDMGSSIGKNWWLHTLPSATGKGVRFGIGHGGSTELDYLFPAGTENDWHFIAATYNGESLLLYGDGKLLHTEVANTIQSDSLPLFFGRRSDGMGYFNGKLDEVRFFDRQIPQTELNMFMNRTVAADAEGLVAYWKFDEGIGSKAFDQTITKSTAFFCGSEWTSDRPEVINAGVTDETGFYEIAGVNYGGGQTFTAKPSKNFYFNQSLEFSAVNQHYAELTDFDIPDTTTISITVKAFDFSSANKTMLKKNNINSNKFRLTLTNGNILLRIGGTQHDFGPLDTGFHCLVMKLHQNGNMVDVDFFKDGDSLGSHSFNSPSTDWTGGSPWTLGANRSGTQVANLFYTGLIDEVAFYDKSLPLSEIQEMANVGTDESHPNLIHYFNLNEGSGTELNDMGSERTDSTGTVYGALWSTVVKHGETSAHEFEPSSRLATLNPSSTSADQVDFTDLSTILVSGYVRFEGTSCFKEGVEILVNGESYFPKIFTDENGYFSADFEPGSTIELTPKFEDHSFIPGFWELRNLSTPVAGILFKDQTTRKITGRVAGGDCQKTIIGDGKTVEVTVSTRNECYSETITLDSLSNGNFTFNNVPADTIEVAITGGNIVLQLPSGTPVSIKDYFSSTNGNHVVDLNLKDTTLAYTYYAPVGLEVDPLPSIAVCNPGFAVMEQFSKNKIDIKVVENYIGGRCYLDSAHLTINNDIADADLLDTMMYGGKFEYEFRASEPRITPPYKKQLDIAVTMADGRDTSILLEAVVTGERPRETAFITVSPEVPTVILRDPPGDASYAYIESGETFCEEKSFEFMASDGQGIVTKASVGPEWEISTGFLFFQVGTEFNVVAEQESSFKWTKTQSTYESTEFCLTTTEVISTKGDGLVVGDAGGGDVFMGGAWNMIYGKTDSILWDAENCVVDTSTGFIIVPNGFETTFIYSENYIRNELIPTLSSLDDSIEVVNWNRMLDFNDSLKAESVFQRNLSFDGSVIYEYSEQAERTKSSSYMVEHSKDKELTAQIGLFVQGVGGSAGPYLNWSSSVINEESSFNGVTVTTGYVLEDDDPGDNFSVDVLMDPRYQTPVFKTVSGQSSCPHEENTQPRDGVDLTSTDGFTALNVPMNDVASFTLLLGNTSQSEDTRTYLLETQQVVNGAVIRFNGSESLNVTIEPFGSIEVVMTVARGPDSFNYDGLKIALYSECEAEVASAIGSEIGEEFYKELTFNVEFQEPCSEVDILLPDPGWVHGVADGTVRDITVYKYDKNDPDLEQINVQYRRTQGNGAWLPIETIINNAGLDPISTDVAWDVGDIGSGLSDGLYEIRAITQCTGGLNPGISHVIPGKIERTAPELFGTPEPADGVLSAGDEISITFNEPINCDNILYADQTQNNNIGLYNTELSGPNGLIDATISCSGDKIIIVPKVPNQVYENKVLRVEVDNIQDLVGNTFIHTEWEFFADQNPLRWNVSNIEDNKYEDEAKTLYREITNEGGSAQLYKIHGSKPDPITGAADPIPNWVNVFPLEGLLAPGEQQIITFEFDEFMPIGMYPDTFYMSGPGGDEPIVIDFRVLCRPPEWEINPASYDYSMNFTVQLDIEGEFSTDNQDIVGAFVDGDLRGYAYVQYVAPLDKYLAFLNVYSNSFTGETVDFRIWDASACHLYGDIIETYTFTGDDLIGSPSLPDTLHTSGQLLRNIPLHEGWNWISFNLEFMNDSLDHALASLEHPDNDLIKDQTSFANYTGAPVNGWIGSLDTLNYISLFQYKADQPDTLDMVGLPIDLMTTEIPIVSGWNWIGYLPQSPLPVGEALETLDPLNGDVIKGQASFAQYVSGLGWIGSLEYMQAPQGYMLNIQNAGTLTYPQSLGGGGMPVNNRTDTSDPRSPWSVHAPDFEHSMTIVGMLSDGMGNVTTEGQTIGAFVGDEVRGVATAMHVEQLGEWLFFLTIYANETEEELTFQLYDESTNETTGLQEQLFFDVNLQVGTPLQPMPFTRQLVNSTAETGYRNGRMIVMPNPFKDITSIHFQTVRNGTATVSILDALGRTVDSFKRNVNSGWNRFDWAADGLKSGVYLIRLEMENVVMTERVVLER